MPKPYKVMIWATDGNESTATKKITVTFMVAARDKADAFHKVLHHPQADVLNSDISARVIITELVNTYLL